MNKKNPVMVTTKHQGVFFGYMTGEPSPEKVVPHSARMCIAWRNMKGLLDLAQSGPGPQCRISSAAPSATIYDITAIVECTPRATEKWESAPWA